MFGALPALATVYIRRALNESERWRQAVREQRWAATERDARTERTTVARPLTIAEIFRQPESRRRVLLLLVMSFASMVGWWAISTWLPVYAQDLARAEHYTNLAAWSSRAATLYTIGTVVSYMSSGFLADAIGRKGFLLVTYAGALLLTPVTYLWTHSVEALLFVAPINGFFTLGLAFSWMAIYLPELFTSSVRSTASSFVFNSTRLVAWVFPILAGSMIQEFGGVSRAAVTMGMVYVLGLLMPWFLPDTTGKPLPD
jgi:MFS family permease